MSPPLRSLTPLFLSLALTLLAACTSCTPGDPQPDPQGGNPNGSGEVASPGDKGAPVLGYSIVATYPHDRASYTQGLIIHEGVLYESTGRYQESNLMTVDMQTGKALLRHRLEPVYFGEGIAIWKGLLVQVTWKEGVAFIYDRRNFQEQYRLTYSGEGWGLCTDDESLIMSDGTDTLRFVGPTDLKVKRLLPVTLDGQSLWNLNELEFIRGEIWANVYQREIIVRIDPETGKVNSVIDLRGLQAKQRVPDLAQDVLNGIAYDAQENKIYITGKHWPNLYEIRVDE
ncbi:MAG: glutaminyl-peptide cyclotransferase [Planctomycetota bacterium]|nr:glutaminyl-peptide cyclotransferase [Planctomycetota bacterium]